MGNDLVLVLLSALSNEKSEQKKLIANGKSILLKPNNAALVI